MASKLHNLARAVMKKPTMFSEEEARQIEAAMDAALGKPPQEPFRNEFSPPRETIYPYMKESAKCNKVNMHAPPDPERYVRPKPATGFWKRAENGWEHKSLPLKATRIRFGGYRLAYTDRLNSHGNPLMIRSFGRLYELQNWVERKWRVKENA